MTRRVLVTGASGFVGRGVVKALVGQGWQVRAASRNPDTMIALAEVERAAMPDLANPADWAPLLEDVSHVVHLAGIAHAPGSLPDDVYTRINADAVGELAAAAAETGVKRFVFVSSVRAQVGVSAEQPITEADDPRPTDAYGRSKLAAETLLAESGVPFTILRPAVVYGRGVKGNLAALATLAKTPTPLPFANLQNRRSLVALENLAQAIAHVLESDQALSETFLVADTEPISVADIVTAIREGLGQPRHLMRAPLGAVKRLMASFGKEAEWERLSGSFVIDASKLRRLGWTPQIATYDGIVQMMRAERGNGASPH